MTEMGENHAPVETQMERLLEIYEEEREEYLATEAKKLGPDGERQLNQLIKAVDTLVKGVQQIAGDDWDRYVELVGQVQNRGTMRLVLDLLEEHLSITFAWEAMEMLSEALERFWNLMGLLGDRKPAPRTMAFLQRVARCCLFAFDSECVVMCRAVLDSEFEDKVVADDQVSEYWNWYKTTPKGQKDRRNPYKERGVRIDAAVHFRLISEEHGKWAHQVRIAGNNAVHQNPSTVDPLDIIRKTVDVLDELERTRGEPR